jgi:hypothetical protein
LQIATEALFDSVEVEAMEARTSAFSASSAQAAWLQQPVSLAAAAGHLIKEQ